MRIPYREPRAHSRASIARVGDTWGRGTVALVAAVVIAPLALLVAGFDPVACAVLGFICIVFVGWLASRPAASVVVLPDRERIRIVRSGGASYSASTLRLSPACAVEIVRVDGARWIRLVDGDGRAARVIIPRDDLEAQEVYDELEELLAHAKRRD